MSQGFSSDSSSEVCQIKCEDFQTIKRQGLKKEGNIAVPKNNFKSFDSLNDDWMVSIFVKMGSNDNVLKIFKEVNISKIKMQNAFQRIFRKAWSKLHQILNKYCSYAVKFARLSRNMILPLIHCRTWMAESDQHSFFTLISSDEVGRQSGMKIEEFISLYEVIKKRINYREGLEDDKQKSTDQKIYEVQQKDPKESNESQFRSIVLKKAKEVHSDGMIMSIQDMIVCSDREIGEEFVNQKTILDILTIMRYRHPSPLWSKDSIVKSIEKIKEVGMKQLLRLDKLYQRKGYEVPKLTVNRAELAYLLSTEKNSQIGRALVELGLTNKSSPKKHAIITSVIDIIHKVMKTQIKR